MRDAFVGQREIINAFRETYRIRNIPVRRIADEAKMSSSTVWRMLSQPDARFDLENVAKAADWLGRPLTGPGVVVAHEPDKLAAICRIIRADTSLDDYAAEWLCNLMISAYDVYARDASGGVRPSENRGA
jgi:hypothetical protein